MSKPRPEPPELVQIAQVIEALCPNAPDIKVHARSFAGIIWNMVCEGVERYHEPEPPK
jgi:hypothetical protein